MSPGCGVLGRKEVVLSFRHDKTEYPELRMMTSTGLPAKPNNDAEREPKGDEVGRLLLACAEPVDPLHLTSSSRQALGPPGVSHGGPNMACERRTVCVAQVLSKETGSL